MIKGYIVVWQGRPMRTARYVSLRAKERGRLFTATRTATIWPTYGAARNAMRRAVRAWGESTTAIGSSSNWWVMRLITPHKGGK